MQSRPLSLVDGGLARAKKLKIAPVWMRMTESGQRALSLSHARAGEAFIIITTYGQPHRDLGT